MKYFDILGNTLIHFLAETLNGKIDTQSHRYLYGKYEANSYGQETASIA